MKKFKRFGAACFILAVAMIGVICLGACGRSSEKAGSYYFDSMRIETDGVIKEYKIGDVLPWGVVATKDVRTVRLKSDGSVLLRLQEDRKGVTGTWEEVEGEPNKITITIEDYPVTCECDGSTLIMISPESSQVIVFKK